MPVLMKKPKCDDKNPPQEDHEQMMLCQWLHRTYPKVRFYSIPNEARRSLRERAKMKAMGLSPGVPDLHVPEWGLWIEMKRKRLGRIRGEQFDWIEHLSGFSTVIVAWGFEDAKEKVEHFLQNRS